MKSVLIATLLAVSGALHGCGPRLPEGVNFVAANDDSLVLNLRGEEWRLFVSGVDRSQELGLKSTATPAGAELQTSFRLTAGAAFGLPQEFSLQKTLGAPYECVECDPVLKAWVRH